MMQGDSCVPPKLKINSVIFAQRKDTLLRLRPFEKESNVHKSTSFYNS
jgi:hypothetical protein